jgi:hypothetical protein
MDVVGHSSVAASLIAGHQRERAKDEQAPPPFCSTRDPNACQVREV